MTSAAIATRSEEKLTEVCECGHIRGIHSNREAMDKFDIQLSGMGLKELSELHCSVCQCMDFHTKEN